MSFRTISLTGLLLATPVSGALADTVEVKAASTKFEPAVVFVKPGDTIKWTNMAGHDTVSLSGMIPDGAQAWQSKMGEEYTTTLNTPGAYVYKCSPHVSLGMVGTIVVGDGKPANLDAIKGSPENKGMIGRAIKQLDKELETKGAN